jgi:hypothetical protein
MALQQWARFGNFAPCPRPRQAPSCARYQIDAQEAKMFVTVYTYRAGAGEKERGLAAT